MKTKLMKIICLILFIMVLLLGIGGAAFYYYNKNMIAQNILMLGISLYGAIIILFFSIVLLTFFHKKLSKMLRATIRSIKNFFLKVCYSIRFCFYLIRWTLSFKKFHLLLVDNLPEEEDLSACKKIKNFSNESIHCYKYKRHQLFFITKDQFSSINKKISHWLKSGYILNRADRGIITWEAEQLADMENDNSIKEINIIIANILKLFGKKIKVSFSINNFSNIKGHEAFSNKSSLNDVISVININETFHQKQYIKEHIEDLLKTSSEKIANQEAALGWYYTANLEKLIDKMHFVIKDIRNSNNKYKKNINCFILTKKVNFLQTIDTLKNHHNLADNGHSSGKNKLFITAFVTAAIFLGLLSNSFFINYNDIQKTKKKLETENVDLLINEKDFSSINKTPKMFYLDHLGLYQKNKIYSTLQPLHDYILQTQFIPLLEKYLSDNLEKSIQSGNKQSVKNALKAYLMLVYPKHYDAKYMINYLSTQDSYQFDNDITRNMLYFMGKNHFNAIKKDNQLISTAQNNLPLINEQINEILDRWAQKLGTTSVLSNKLARYFINNKSMQISTLYTNQGYQYFNKNIGKIENDIYKNAWIYNKNDLPTKEQIIRLINKSYYVKYISSWKNLRDNTSIIYFNNLRQAQNVLSNIVKDDAFKSLSKQVLALAYIPEDNSHLANKIDSDLQPIFNYVNGQQNKALIKSLADLEKLIAEINASKSPTESSFELLKNISKTGDAKQFDAVKEALQSSPMVIQDLSSKLLQNSSQAIFDSAQTYIQYQWEKIFPEVRDFIDGYYPFNANSSIDSSIMQWQQFFSNDGLITLFIHQNLNGLVDLKTGQLFNLYGGSLKLSNNTVHDFMFFNEINKDLINPKNSSVKFTMKPMYLSNNAKSIDLSMLDKNYKYVHGPLIDYSFSLPSKNPSAVSKLSWNGFDGKAVNIETSGSWSWLRLIQNAEINKINDQSWMLTFKEKGYSVKYAIDSNANIGLLLGNNIHHINLNEKLKGE